MRCAKQGPHDPRVDERNLEEVDDDVRSAIGRKPFQFVGE
jgi:hypothetical protein